MPLPERTGVPSRSALRSRGARRQYDAVDPENRLVAAELERRWNMKPSQAQASVEAELERLKQAQSGPAQRSGARGTRAAWGRVPPRVWNHPAASPEDSKKRILRVLLKEIVVKVMGHQIMMVLHWQEVIALDLQFPENKTGQHRWTTATEVEHLIEELARVMPDRGMAALLNRTGETYRPWPCGGPGDAGVQLP
ncbi:MAG: hypothetical protein MZV64_71690 [Ignavibacteriales bacterium]|nr:hypothetical protein [Ignavibacteriales bacterium]